MCGPGLLQKFLALSRIKQTLASFLWILPARGKHWRSKGKGSYLGKWVRSVDLFRYRHFTLIQETFMEREKSSVLLIQVLFAPSFTHRLDPPLRHLTFKAFVQVRGGSFKALERVSVLVSATRPRPVTCSSGRGRCLLASVTSGSLSVASERALGFLTPGAEREYAGPRPHTSNPLPGRSPTPAAGPRAALRSSVGGRRGKWRRCLTSPFAASLDPLLRLPSPPPVQTLRPFALQAPPRQKPTPCNGSAAAGAPALGGGARLGSRSCGVGAGVPQGQCRGARGPGGGACGACFSPRPLWGSHLCLRGGEALWGRERADPIGGGGQGGAAAGVGGGGRLVCWG